MIKIRYNFTYRLKKKWLKLEIIILVEKIYIIYNLSNNIIICINNLNKLLSLIIFLINYDIRVIINKYKNILNLSQIIKNFFLIII